MKKYLAIVLAIVMVLSLAACGAKTEASVASAPAASTAPAAAEKKEFKPDGPVTLIVAYKAGNGTDITARVLAKYAEKYIGQSIVIENVDGGSGSIGWSQLADAKADGMTIGFVNLPNFNSSIVNELGTYKIDDFAPICNHVTETSVIVVRADDTRFNSLEDLVAYAKANTTKASTNGAQASNHIGAQAFANSAGFKYIDIPQGNTANELLSLSGGEADWCVVKIADLAGKESSYKVLGIFDTQKSTEKGYENVPTLGSLGYYKDWLGSSRMICAPAGVSEEVVNFYADAFKKAMEDADYLKAATEGKITTNYIDPKGSAELFKQQQEFTEGLSNGFWN